MPVAERALRTFGAWSQRHQIIEECAELILAISHYRRGRVSKKKVCEEIADVLICAEQMRLDFGAADVDRIKRTKEKRLKKRMAVYVGGN
jgi:NTP pyrophosphatase (non-canonical NTP hydrolase)